MMTRSKMILVIVCALGLGSYCLWKSNVDSKKPEQPAVVESMKGNLVYALRDIKKGSVVTSDSIETRIVEQCQIPGSAVWKASTVIGRKTVHGIEKGQILSQYDFLTAEQAERYTRSKFEPPAIPPDSEFKKPTNNH
ncbi:MAG: SAF domain-containing protein [Candidatus Melainabacteria bacterium]|nr:SAF domain-containing protein [Candidatus Melainabacteria bacterium]